MFVALSNNFLMEVTPIPIEMVLVGWSGLVLSGMGFQMGSHSNAFQISRNVTPKHPPKNHQSAVSPRCPGAFSKLWSASRATHSAGHFSLAGYGWIHLCVTSDLARCQLNMSMWFGSPQMVPKSTEILNLKRGNGLALYWIYWSLPENRVPYILIGWSSFIIVLEKLLCWCIRPIFSHINIIQYHSSAAI